MAKLPKIVEAARPYIDAGRLALLLVYIREAHPSDGWAMKAGDGLCYMQPKTLNARLAIAKKFLDHEPAAKGVTLVADDPATNLIDKAYEAPPERLVVLEKQSSCLGHRYTVVFASGQGPFQYSVEALTAFLAERLGYRLGRESKSLCRG